MPQFLNTNDRNFEEVFQAVLAAKREDSPDVDAVVADIILDVRSRGDEAVLELTKKFDRLQLDADGLRFTNAEIDNYCMQVGDHDRAARGTRGGQGTGHLVDPRRHDPRRA